MPKRWSTHAPSPPRRDCRRATSSRSCRPSSSRSRGRSDRAVLRQRARTARRAAPRVKGLPRPACEPVRTRVWVPRATGAATREQRRTVRAAGRRGRRNDAEPTRARASLASSRTRSAVPRAASADSPTRRRPSTPARAMRRRPGVRPAGRSTGSTSTPTPTSTPSSTRTSPRITCATITTRAPRTRAAATTATFSGGDDDFSGAMTTSTPRRLSWYGRRVASSVSSRECLP
mmetsp:Transcript_16669/g.67215  ORF Transcript_16669/g.67215 Transcript_16669/m.67215 type:complete len:232 (+) Transcript_16669:273-968(+)